MFQRRRHAAILTQLRPLASPIPLPETRRSFARGQTTKSSRLLTGRFRFGSAPELTFPQVFRLPFETSL